MKIMQHSGISTRLATITIITFFANSASGQDEALPCPAPLTDSTEDIQDALFATRDNGTLHLGACTYYLTHPIEARWNHHGTIQGQGKDLTFIKILPGAKIDGVPIAAADGASLSTLFLFENPESGDITISDLSIVVTDPEPAGNQDDPPSLPGWWRGALYNLIVVTGPNVSSRFERSSFRGAPGNFFGFNVAHVSHVLNRFDAASGRPRMVGSHTVTDCEFANAVVTVGPSGTLEVDITGNTFTNTKYGPWIDDCDGCTVKISRNLIIGVQWYGIWLTQTDQWVAPSNYLVSKNTIQTSDVADAIFLQNLPTTQVVVSKNDITMDSIWGGIGGVNVPEVLVANNKVNGIGMNGIWALGGADWTLVGNNVNNFTAVPNFWSSFFGYPVGSIALYESTGFMIVGGKNKTNVVWTGGSGHVFTGVNNMQYSGGGQRVSDAMAKRQEIRNTMP